MVQASESRWVLAGMVVTIFTTLAVLSYGTLEQGNQFDRTLDGQDRLLSRLEQLLESNQASIEHSEDVVERIKDCTDPEGECFRAQLESQGLEKVLGHVSSDTARKISCILLIQPSERTRQLIDKCLANGGTR